MLVLDTDHLSALEWRGSEKAKRLRDRLDRSPETQVTTIVTYEEQCRGWLAYITRASSMEQQIDAYERLANHLKFYLELIVLDFDRLAAEEFQQLRNARIQIGTLDLKIAAITLAHDATLLSRNLKDSKIRKIILVDGRPKGIFSAPLAILDAWLGGGKYFRSPEELTALVKPYLKVIESGEFSANFSFYTYPYLVATAIKP